MHKNPVIGITLDLVSDSEKYKYARFPWYALRQNYANSVIKAGGIPVMIPYQMGAIDDILNMIDGLIIPGGDEDINPKFYGQTVQSDKVKTNDERGLFELTLLQKALEVDKPFLGICNGMQLLNVVLGGTLIQHIPDFAPSDINHEQPDPKDVPSHLIHIKEGTMLASLSTQKELLVNSTHHQGIDKLGDGLVASAIAPDGIIEAIESSRHKFALGALWHPEYLNSELDMNLFSALICATK